MLYGSDLVERDFLIYRDNVLKYDTNALYINSNKSSKSSIIQDVNKEYNLNKFNKDLNKEFIFNRDSFNFKSLYPVSGIESENNYLLIVHD